MTATTTEKPAQAAKGTVLAQDPGAGTEVDEGTQVTVTVAVALSRVPKVEGKRIGPAKSILRGAEFQRNVVQRDTTTGLTAASSSSGPRRALV